MSIFELWLFTTAIPGVGNSLCTISVITLTAALASVMAQIPLWVEGAETKTKLLVYRWTKLLLAVGVFTGIFANFFPSERQMLLIAGGYTATNNADIKKLPTNAAKAVNAWLDAVTEAAEKTQKSTKN